MLHSGVNITASPARPDVTVSVLEDYHLSLLSDVEMVERREERRGDCLDTNLWLRVFLPRPLSVSDER